MATLAELVVKISGDTASLTAALGRAEKSTGSTADKMGKVLKAGAVAAAAGIGTAVLALGSCVGEAMAAQKVLTQTNAVLGSTKGVSGMTAKSVEDLANSLSKVIPIDDELIQQTENMLLTFTRVGKDIFPQATEAALNMATALGTDPVDAAMKLGKALNDPIAGVTALRKVGVMLTDQQKDQIKAMVEAGDVAGAQAVILKELETEFGNSGRAAGQTAAGQFAILGTQIGNVKESIGMALIPTLTKLAGYMIDTVIPATQKFVEEWGPKLKTLFDDVKTAISPVTDAMGKFFGLFEKKDLGLIFAAIAVSIVAGFVAIAVAAGLAFIAENAALLGIPIAVGLAIAALTLLVTHWDAVWAGLQRAPAAVLNWLKTSWQDALLIIAGPAGWLALLIKNWDSVWGAMPLGVQQAMVRVGNLVISAANNVISAFEFAVNKSLEAFNWLADKFGGALGKIGVNVNLEVGNLSLGRLDAVTGPVKAYAGTMDNFLEQNKKAKKSVAELIPPVLNLGDGLGDLGGGGGSAAKAADALSETEKALISLLNYFNASGLTVEQYTFFLNMAQEAMTHFNLTGEQLATVLQNSGLAAMDFAERIQRLTALDDLTEQAKTAMDAVNGLYDAFNNVFAKPTKEGAAQNLALAQLKEQRARLLAGGEESDSRKVKKIDEQIDAIQKEIDVRRASQDVAKAQLDLADQTKLTDEQQNIAVGLITTAMGTASGNAQTLAGSLFNLTQSLAQWGLQMRAWVETVTAGHPSAQTSRDIYDSLSDEGRRYVDIMAGLQNAPSFANGGVMPYTGFAHLEKGEPVGVAAGSHQTFYGPVTVQVVGGGEDILAQVERQLR